MLAELGDAAANYYLYNAYKNGNGVEKNNEKALYWLKESAKINVAWLPELMTFSESLDPKELFDISVNHALSGSTIAMVWVGRMYRDGWGVEKNNEKALYWLKQTAKLGEKYIEEYNTLNEIVQKNVSEGAVKNE